MNVCNLLFRKLWEMLQTLLTVSKTEWVRWCMSLHFGSVATSIDSLPTPVQPLYPISYGLLISFTTHENLYTQFVAYNSTIIVFQPTSRDLFRAFPHTAPYSSNPQACILATPQPTIIDQKVWANPNYSRSSATLVHLSIIGHPGSFNLFRNGPIHQPFTPPSPISRYN